MNITYELKISFSNTEKNAEQLKSMVINFLHDSGITSFVEGFIDNLDIDHDYHNEQRDHYAEQGGEVSPLLYYSFDREELEELQDKLIQTFDRALITDISSIDTQKWQEGWKENFKPILTRLFYIFPPWEDKSAIPEKFIPVEIEPGMAFGTGQHETTRLCVQALENVYQTGAPQSVLDVGTGSGILAICCRKLGSPQIFATDIDKNAVIATEQNFLSNGLGAIKIFHGSIPRAMFPDFLGKDKTGFDLVIANILFVVIKEIFPDLVASTAKNGTLLLSGILAEQKKELDDISKNFGLLQKDCIQMSDWIAVTYTKK